MNAVINIHYLGTGGKMLQSGSFPLRGRKPEQIALEYWKQIQKESSYHAKLEKVTSDGEDITDLVKDLEEQELRKKFAESEDLPF
ncbi:hypothetical protein [Neobacillus massiliamazoniensis]|uniref:Uncharacterized protein n=1 Tax=Neobacillus massiliamazoniensis TaxID=1499688 RepID=A0A0U1NRB2_9BACI|nr:hypothetical protein [Neobacillus massiliamazoniensis]CRK80288.1 hypothetical protein BN000_00169 [Neobacillus massiliamazoniensis]